MRKIYLLLILNIFGFVSAQNSDYKKSIDSLLTHFQANNAFSGSVMLQKDGETVYKGEFNKFANGSEKYRIGSITKIFTAIITFQLIEEGKLSLEDIVAYAKANGEPKQTSGKQELYEAIVNMYC